MVINASKSERRRKTLHINQKEAQNWLKIITLEEERALLFTQTEVHILISSFLRGLFLSESHQSRMFECILRKKDNYLRILNGQIVAFVYDENINFTLS